MDNHDELAAFNNNGYFEGLSEELEAEHSTLLAEVRDILAGEQGYSTSRFKNPRWSSTALPLREAVLKRNIIRNQKLYNAAAVTCAKTMLKLHLDRIELETVQDARARSWQDFEERKGSGDLYQGHRIFADRLFEHGIGTNKLLSLEDNELQTLAVVINGFLEQRDKRVIS